MTDLRVPGSRALWFRRYVASIAARMGLQLADAQDMVSSCLLKLLVAVPPEDCLCIESWCKVVIRNAATDWWRKRNRIVKNERSCWTVAEEHDSRSFAFDGLAAELLTVDAALRRLPRKDEEAIMLYAIGLSDVQSARQQKISVPAYKSRKMRAYDKLERGAA